LNMAKDQGAGWQSGYNEMVIQLIFPNPLAEEIGDTFRTLEYPLADHSGRRFQTHNQVSAIGRRQTNFNQ